MTPEQARELYLLATVTTRTSPSDLEAQAWVLLLADDDYDVIRLALTNKLRSSKFMPQIAEIVEEAQALRGDLPPKLDEAVGMLTAGDLSHSLVAEAWSRHMKNGGLDPTYPDSDVQKTAKFQLREAYQAVLHEHNREQRDEQMAELTGGPIADMLGPGKPELGDGR